MRAAWEPHLAQNNVTGFYSLIFEIERKKKFEIHKKLIENLNNSPFAKKQKEAPHTVSVYIFH